MEIGREIVPAIVVVWRPVSLLLGHGFLMELQTMREGELGREKKGKIVLDLRCLFFQENELDPRAHQKKKLIVKFIA